MKYLITLPNVAQKIVNVQVELYVNESITLYLPNWRPGRYERQNYAACLSDLMAKNTQGEEVAIQQITSHQWKIIAKGGSLITLSYSFYANKDDAGGSYVDEQQIYLNPINLFLYSDDQSPCKLNIQLPSDYIIGGALPQKDQEGNYLFKNFHHLADTPFVAARQERLQHATFEVAGLATHLWFLGNCRPNFERIKRDFTLFMKPQMRLFGDCPTDNYHYLFVMLPRPFRHGVEHEHSTVITMGPDYQLMTPAFYRSLLEISSHEFFHTWNVKSLRPADMYPYDYRDENYSSLHYITEGVTTYYGDLMLWRGGNWTMDQWLKNIAQELTNLLGIGSGEAHTSLTEASMNSWTNGYKKEGMPNRKVSFYTKGNIIAMLTDFCIRRSGNKSLDDVLYSMYQHIAKAKRGYTREDYRAAIIAACDADKHDWVDSFFADYIDGTTDIRPLLKEFCDFMGLQIVESPLGSQAESKWGAKVGVSTQGFAKIDKLAESTPNRTNPLREAGLQIGDEIIAIDGRKVYNNLEALLAYYQGDCSLNIHYFRQNEIKQTSVHLPARAIYTIPVCIPELMISSAQAMARKSWQVGTSTTAPI